MRIAIPKGRLQEPALAMFAAAGLPVPSPAELATRRLVFNGRGVEWIFVKDRDVPVYVEHGAADAGIAGLDQLLEHESTASQPVTMPFGVCRMMLIAAPDERPLRSIATKYPRIAHRYLEERGLRADVVALGGSVELAAVLALTTHVIDLVETGETVRIHNLVLQDTVAEIAPRLIVGRDICRTSPDRVQELVARVSEAVEGVIA